MAWRIRAESRDLKILRGADAGESAAAIAVSTKSVCPRAPPMSRLSAASGSSASASRSASGSGSYFAIGKKLPTGPDASSDRRFSNQPARLAVSAARCNGLTPAHGEAGSTSHRRWSTSPDTRVSHAVPDGPPLAPIDPTRRPRPAVHVPMTDRSQVEPVNRIRADDVDALAAPDQRRRHRRAPARIERPRDALRTRHRTARHRRRIQRRCAFERPGRQRGTHTATARGLQDRGHDLVGQA